MRRAGRWGLIGAGFVAAVIAAAVAALPGFVERQVTARLVALGFPDARVMDVGLGLGRVRVGSIWLDAEGASRIGPVTLDYTLGGLLDGRVDRITVEAGRLAVGTTDGITVAGVPLPRGAGGGGLAMPVGRIALARFEIALDTALGAVTVVLTDGAAVPRAGALTVDSRFDARLAGPALEADLRGALSATLGDGTSVAVDVADGKGAGAGARVEGIAGWLVMALGDGLPEIAGELAATSATVAGVALATPSLIVDGTPVALTVVARADGAAGASLRADATLDVAARGGPVTLAMDVPDLAAAGAPAVGRLAIALDGRAALDEDDAPSFAGRATVRLDNGALDALADEASVDAVLGVHADGQGLTLATQRPLEVEGRWLGALPPALAPLADGTVALIVEGTVRATRSSEGIAIGGRGDAVLEVADGQRARLEIGGGRVALGGDGRLRAVETLAFRATAPAVDLGVARLAGATIEGEIGGAPGSWSGRVVLDATAALDLTAPEVQTDALDLSAVGRFAFEGDALSFSPTDCVALRATTIRVGPALVHPTNRVCVLSIPEAPFLTADPASGVTIGLRVLPFLADVEPVAGEDFPAFAVTTPKIRTRLAFGPDGRPGAAWFNLGAGSITVPAYQAVISFIESTIEAADGPPYRFAFRGDVKHTAPVPAVVTVGFTVKGSATPEAIDAEADLRGANGALALDLDARHDIALGAGHAAIRLHPLTFIPDVRTPAQVFPVLEAVEAASGTVEATGRLAWSATAPPDGQATIALRDVNASVAGVSARAINGVVAFDGLNPPSMPPGQTVAIGQLDVGVPLVNGTLVFGLGRDGVLGVDRAVWDWAGGTIYAEPFQAALDAGEWQATLAAKDLDLAAILALAEVDGLTGTGTLAGRLPLRLGFATVAVEDGHLATTGPGTLHYAPNGGADVLDTGQAGTDLLLDALANFHYDDLSLAINGIAGGETAVALRLVGRNPDLYDGYPVALNVKLEGALDTLLRRGLAGYRIPETVRERLEDFAEGAP